MSSSAETQVYHALVDAGFVPERYVQHKPMGFEYVVEQFLVAVYAMGQNLDVSAMGMLGRLHRLGIVDEEVDPEQLIAFTSRIR